MKRTIKAIKYVLVGTTIFLVTVFVILESVRYFFQRESRQINWIESANGIDSMELVRLGGMDQWIYIRSEDKNKPILLFLHGGPGSPEMPMAVKQFQGKLEKEFVIVHWDQRGAGKSYSSDQNVDRFTMDDYVFDTVVLTQLLLKRFGKQKLYLVGHSWGSALGLTVISRFPQYYHAYIGIGQVTNMMRGEKLSYRFVLEESRRRGEMEIAAKLESMGEPPYANFSDLGYERGLVNRYGGGIHKETNPMLMIARFYFSFPGYNTIDILYRFPTGAFRSLNGLWPWIQNVDLFKEVPQVAIPVYFCTGRYDNTVPSSLTYEYFLHLKAPKKKFIWFEESAHSPNFEEADKFYRVMMEDVLQGKN